MKKLMSFGAVCSGLLFVSVCVGLMTAGPSVAQGGATGGKDVRIINTAADAVPVAVQGTQNVNVGNTPTVNVNSLPAVQVGNDSGSPVPVNVTNLPAGQAAEPVMISFDVAVPGSVFVASKDVYTVPAGKRLVLEYASFEANLREGSWQHKVKLQTTFEGNTRHHYLLADRLFFFSFYYQTVFEGEVRMYADPGTVVRVIVNYSSSDTPTSTFHTEGTLTGFLVDAP